MPRKEAESSTSTGRREALSDSPARVAPLRAGAKYPPPYGAQRRQDALWEGGNEALPPRWQQFQVLSGATGYQDNTLTMVSWNRPLPGVRLDRPGQLVIDGCEWHISPFGRSYFVNHNSRTTSWKKPKPVRPAESLVPECIIEGHSECIWSLACLGTSCDILSASDDCSIRHWKRDGEPVGKPLDSDGGGIGPMTLSPDETMAVSGSTDGRLRLWNIRKGIMVGDPWEGHNDPVRCLDWSPNALEIASGSQDGTIRRWNPDTGRQTAPPVETRHGCVDAVKYSPQGDTFASGGEDENICVWSKNGQLLIEIKGHENVVTSLCWSKDGAHVFSGSGDHTIRKWRSVDGEELVVLRGHTNNVMSLCLSLNENYIVSASDDYSVRIWDLKTNQPVGDPLLHDDGVVALAISCDGQYIASGGLDGKIHLWSMEAALNQRGGDPVGRVDDANAKPDAKFKGHPVRPRDHFSSHPIFSKQRPSNKGSAKYGKEFFANDTNRAPPPPASPSAGLHSLFSSLRFRPRPPNSPRSTTREPRHWNFNLIPVGISRRTVDVAAARDEDRYGITPETDAEAAAAMQRTNVNEADSSTQPGQPTPMVQGSQRRPTETQGPSGGTGDVYYEVNCCGFFFGRRHPTSHRS